jgi:hypothetical protein
MNKEEKYINSIKSLISDINMLQKYRIELENKSLKNNPYYKYQNEDDLNNKFKKDLQINEKEYFKRFED